MKRGFIIFGLLLAALSAAAWADPSATELLNRFRQAAPVEFRYQETRRLELLDQPWRGAGYLLSAPDGTLVKLQTAPERVVMAISGDRMYYYDAAHQQRQSAPLAYAGEMAEQIGTFRAIIQGRAEELAADYDIRAESKDQRWTLRLDGKTDAAEEPATRIEISGDETQGQRRIAIHPPTGEDTEYSLDKSREGAAVEAPLRQLVSEAAGE
ncbi:LolA-related protein [Methylomagnum sp.]